MRNSLPIVLALLASASTVPTASAGGLPALPAIGRIAGTAPSPSTSKSSNTAAKGAFEAICGVSTSAIGPQLVGDVNTGNTGWFKHLWRDVVVKADRSQFVANKADKTVYHQVSTSKSLKRVIKAGEPLLVTECVTMGGSYIHTMTVDGLFEGSFRADDLVRAPASFTFSAHTSPAFDVMTAYQDASPADRAVAPDMARLEKKKGECMTQALGECMAAEKKVESGPYRSDLDAAKATACTEARDRFLATCMGEADKRAYAAGARQVYDATVESDAAFWAAMEAKLGG